MKFVQITVHFEYSDDIDRFLDRHEVVDYVRYNMTDGKDQEGKHFGSQVFPGSFSVYQAQVRDDEVEGLFSDMEEFRTSKPAHRHLQAVVVSIERSLRGDEEDSGD